MSVGDDLANDDRLRLAYAGLNPEKLGRLLAEHGPRRTLRLVRSHPDGAAVGVRGAADVDASVRRQELASIGLEIRFRGDPGYPDSLTGIPDPPDLLFVRGRLPTGPTVAVVGTRRCTAYGRQLATEYGVAIADAGWVLVSGLARGIDGAAHTGTVTAGGAGIAVLGCGPDIDYPPEHRTLGERLVEAGGAVVTEYPPGAAPEPWRFPLRNRIISGLSSAVVVVEAGVTGGALITAGYALAHGVPVFAVPGDVRRESSTGCNLLIRDGAHPVLDPDDLIEELSLVLGPPAKVGSDPPGGPDGHLEAGSRPDSSATSW
ncbi:MAG: DNA-processing protein DprA [Acidimicrobiia bacterium]